MNLENLKMDCRHFNGSIPCIYNKEYNVHCTESNNKSCDYYDPIESNLLIIKLGAAGDVIRTTPLLGAIRRKYPQAYITWLTHFPDLVPSRKDNSDGVDKIYNWDEKNLIVIENRHYDVIINLDKDEYACALMSKLKSSEQYGYSLKNDKPYPINKLAEHKYFTGIFDDISIKNEKSYLKEIFEICGLKFEGEEYILPEFVQCNYSNIDRSKKVIGLNTGCGGRWTSRLLPDSFWIELIQLLQNEKYEVIILGGPEEHSKNLKLAQRTEAKYFGTMPLKNFMGLMNACDVVVTSVTMGMHIAIGLKKKVIIINNIFNKNEFELYGNGKIVEPEKPCRCYFQPTCKNDEYKCIEYIKSSTVFEAICS